MSNRKEYDEIVREITSDFKGKWEKYLEILNAEEGSSNALKSIEGDELNIALIECIKTFIKLGPDEDFEEALLVFKDFVEIKVITDEQFEKISILWFGEER